MEQEQTVAPGSTKPPASEQAALPPPKLPGVIQLIKESWAQFVANPWTIILLLLLPLGVMFIAGIVVAIGSASFLAVGASKAAMTTMMVIAGIIYLGFLALNLIVNMAVFHTIANEEKKLGFGQAFKLGAKHFWPFLWLSFIIVAVIYGGMILLIVPGLIAIIYTILSVFVLTKEDLRGFAAIKKSHALVSGYWWALFGRFILLYFLIMLAVMVVGMAGATIFGLLAKISIIVSVLLSILSIAVMIALMMLIMPLAMIFIYRVYHHLSLIKSGTTITAGNKVNIIYKILFSLGILILIVYLGVFVKSFSRGNFQKGLKNDFNPSNFNFGSGFESNSNVDSNSDFATESNFDFDFGNDALNFDPIE